MTNYIIVQALNITIIVGFALLLVSKARADFKRRLRALEQAMPSGAGSEQQRKLALQTKINALQKELNALNTTAALRPPESTTI